MAWFALLMATLALAVALSDQPWLLEFVNRVRANALFVQEDFRTRREADRVDDAEAIDDLGAARRAASLGDAEELRERLTSAAVRLRESAEGLTEALRDRRQALATEIEEIAEDAETGAEGVRAINDLTRRLEALRPDSETDSD